MFDALRLGLVGLASAVALIGGEAAAAQQPSTPIAELRQQAQAGDRSAQVDLGIRLMMTNQEPDLVEARRWLRAAMDAGDAEAKNAYAGLLINGGGGPRDETLGQRLLAEAAAEGSVGANLTLSAAYRDGNGGFARDPGRAFAHMNAAAASAHGESAQLVFWQLGMMHLRGTGTPANPQEAYRWVSRAADAGGVNGMISRAVMLATGEGTQEDDAAARLWYQRASESGQRLFAHGMRGLGSMLVTGEGGPVDLPRGIAYLRIAKAGNDAQAGTLLERWRDRITPEIDREAQRIANQWMAEHMGAND